MTLAALGLLSASSAWAQSGSVSYCRALAQKYTSYVGTSPFGPSQPADRRNDPQARLALTQCSDNPQSAIPVLEAKLRNARVELPRR